MKTDGINDCNRQEDLVAYLYDESSAVERASFEHHLEACQSCRSELKAFGRVRDDLTTWQIGFPPRTEVALPKKRLESLRELISLFPVWARGAGLTAAAASLLLFAISFAGAGINLRSANPQQIEALVTEAVAKERAQMQNEYQAQMASFKEQLVSEQREQIQALNAANQASLAAVKASLKAEIKKSNRQHSSIRSFFAMDDYQDTLGDVK